MADDMVNIHAARTEAGQNGWWFQLDKGWYFVDTSRSGISSNVLETDLSTRPVRIATTDPDAVGRCGESAPTVFGSRTSQTCVLPSGHAGWHSAVDGCEWGPVPRGGELLDEAIPAGLSAEQEIRARAAQLWLEDGFNPPRWKLGDWCVWIRDGRTPEDAAPSGTVGNPQP